MTKTAPAKKRAAATKSAAPRKRAAATQSATKGTKKTAAAAKRTATTRKRSPAKTAPRKRRAPAIDRDAAYVPPLVDAVTSAAVFARLRVLHPDAHCELDHGSSFELLVATVLSAQTTDVLVNKITPELFALYPEPRALAEARQADVAGLLRRRGMGMFNQKARNIIGLARDLVERHGGQVPRTLAELVRLPGVGRKTANVVLGVAFGAPEGVVVDTHVQRVSQRLGWTTNTKPEAIERDLCARFPREDWDMLSHTLIFHGRRICFARKPACAACGVNDACPSAFRADNVGRKPPRARPRPRPAATEVGKREVAKRGRVIR